MLARIGVTIMGLGLLAVTSVNVSAQGSSLPDPETVSVEVISDGLRTSPADWMALTRRILSENEGRTSPLLAALELLLTDSSVSSESAFLVARSMGRASVSNPQIRDRVSQIFRDGVRAGGTNVAAGLHGAQAGPPALKAQVVGWVVPLFAQEEFSDLEEVLIVDALGAFELGPTGLGMTAINRLLARDRLRTVKGRLKAEAIKGARGGAQ